MVIALALLIPASGIYSVVADAEAGGGGRAAQEHDGGESGGRGAWRRSTRSCPWCSAPARCSSFLESNPVERITVDLQAADVERVRAHRADRVAGQAVCVLPQRHGNQDLRGQGRHRALGRQADLRAARRPRPGQRGDAGAPGPALCRRPAPVREGRLESRRERRAVGHADRWACWASCSSSSRASSSRSSSWSRPRSTAASRTWWAWTTSRPRSRRSRTSTSGAPNTPSTASASRST